MLTEKEQEEVARLYNEEGMLTEKEQEEVARLYNEEGMSPEDIAKELGLDKIDVINYCAEIL